MYVLKKEKEKEDVLISFSKSINHILERIPLRTDCIAFIYTNLTIFFFIGFIIYKNTLLTYFSSTVQQMHIIEHSVTQFNTLENFSYSNMKLRIFHFSFVLMGLYLI